MHTTNIIRKTILIGIAFAAFGAATATALGGGQDVNAAGRSGLGNFEIQVSMSRYAIATDGAKGGNVEFEWKVESGEEAIKPIDGLKAEMEVVEGKIEHEWTVEEG